MTRQLLVALTVLLAASASAADTRPAAKSKSAPTSRTSGVLIKLEPASGRLVLHDAAGHDEEFVASKATRILRDGRKATLKESRVGDLALRAVYDPQTKILASLTLKSAPTPKADADDARRPTVQGEIAGTDVIKETISVRLGGGANIEFKVAGAKILREAEGKPAETILLEAVKIGDLVEVHAPDWKTADEIHVRAAATTR